jgi:hypothetical protein
VRSSCHEEWKEIVWSAALFGVLENGYSEVRFEDMNGKREER